MTKLLNLPKFLEEINYESNPLEELVYNNIKIPEKYPENLKKIILYREITFKDLLIHPSDK